MKLTNEEKRHTQKESSPKNPAEFTLATPLDTMLLATNTCNPGVVKFVVFPKFKFVVTHVPRLDKQVLAPHLFYLQ